MLVSIQAVTNHTIYISDIKRREKEIEAMDIEITLNHIQEMQQILDSFKNKLLSSSVVESKNIKGNHLMQDISILHDTITDLGDKYDSSDEIKEKEEENKIIVNVKRSTVQVFYVSSYCVATASIYLC